MDLAEEMEKKKMSIITNDRYFILKKKPFDSSLVFLVQTDFKTGYILQSPARWDEQAQAYKLVGHGVAGQTAKMYPAKGKLYNFLVKNRMEFTTQAV